MTHYYYYYIIIINIIIIIIIKKNMIAPVAPRWILVAVIGYQANNWCMVTHYYYYYIIIILLLSAALRSNAADYVLPLFIFYFLFTIRSQKLPDRFSPNFQELCILV